MTGPRLYHRLGTRSILGVMALTLAVPANAGEQDEQLWLQANANVPIAERWRLTLEGIARYSDRAGGLYQTEFGGLVSYKIADHVELGFGYRRVGRHNGVGSDEHRTRQQVVATFGNVTTRLRVDERFHPGGDEIGFRVRPLVRLNRPVGGGFALFASHESFLLPNSTRWGQRAGYERMRNSVGVTLPIARGVSGDLGYLNQYRFARGGAASQMDHALSFQLTLTLGAPRPHKADD